jgi:hypothetical protein
VQAPLQLTNAHPESGVALRATAVPGANDAAHVAGHATPLGLLATEPRPVRATDSLRVRTNVAATVWEVASESVHVAVVPVQAPLHLSNEEPADGAAVNTTLAPTGNAALHAVPQEIPAGALVTVPSPSPERVTDSEFAGANVAPAEVVFDATALQVAPCPLHIPSQLTNRKPGSGVAVNVSL